MICVDASLGAKWVLPEDYSEQALALVAVCGRTGRRIMAPPLLPIEVTNILRRRMVQSGMSLSQAQELVRRFHTFSVTLHTTADLYEQALAIAEAHNLPAAYDAHYVALAQALGCNLWTDDRRLIRTLAGKLPFVKWIGDYQGEESL